MRPSKQVVYKTSVLAPEAGIPFFFRGLGRGTFRYCILRIRCAVGNAHGIEVKPGTAGGWKRIINDIALTVKINAVTDNINNSDMGEL
ncbi:MAG: hypothetical protein PF495_11265 [Spirochaetales bacterium]|jgi:hypothetical protein|nr:hypothetical protein [Spirochaetales bacterium]